jgi:hypothetical protein
MLQAPAAALMAAPPPAFCGCAAGQWLEVNYSEELSAAANSAASRIFGGNGSQAPQRDVAPASAVPAADWS